MLPQPDITTVADTIALRNIYVIWNCVTYLELEQLSLVNMTLFLNRWAAARYRALASIIPGPERFSRNLSS